jgi:diacylglycerol kinase (ATP)
MHSRSGKNSARRATELLTEAGFGLRVLDSPPANRLSSVIEQEGKDASLIIVGGGDGTLNAAAAGIHALGRPLGILPLGTANDLARTVGIPFDLESAVNVIRNGVQRTIDLGTVNGHMFFNVASVGISSDLARELDPDVKRRFGRFGYAIAGIRVLGRAKPFRATIKTANETLRTTTLQIAVGNGRYYGGGNVIEEGAEIDDAILRLYSLEFAKAWKIILSFHRFRRGTHGNLEEVQTLHSDQIEIHTSRPRPVNADGELITQTPAKFGILRKAIQVFVPKNE